jgi:hypothetical protein
MEELHIQAEGGRIEITGEWEGDFYGAMESGIF